MGLIPIAQSGRVALKQVRAWFLAVPGRPSVFVDPLERGDEASFNQLR